MGDSLTKFCVSWTINVVQSAIKNFIAAWNNHCLPGNRGGIPNVLARRANQTVRLDPANIPDTPFAIRLHEQSGRQRRVVSLVTDHEPFTCTAYMTVRNSLCLMCNALHFVCNMHAHDVTHPPHTQCLHSQCLSFWMLATEESCNIVKPSQFKKNV